MDTSSLYDLTPIAWLMARRRADRARPAGLGVAPQRRRRPGAAAACADRAHAVPHLRPHAVRRLHAPDRFGPRLSRLARLLRQRQPGRRAPRDRDGAGGPADRAGHPRQGLGRDGAPLPGDRRRRADPHARGWRRGSCAAASAERRAARRQAHHPHAQRLVARRDPGRGSACRAPLARSPSRGSCSPPSSRCI